MNTVGMAISDSTGAPARRLTRAEAKAQTREQILGAAEVVFGRNGYHGASLDQVAAEAGFTKGAVYSTFDSKADLFLALLDRRAGGRREEIDLALEQAGSAEEFSAGLARRFAESVSAERDFWSALIEFMVLVGRNEGLRRRFAEHHDASREAVAASIREWGAREGVPSTIEPRRLATSIIALNNGLTLEGLLSSEDVDVELYVEAQLALLRASTEEKSAGEEPR